MIRIPWYSPLPEPPLQKQRTFKDRKEIVYNMGRIPLVEVMTSICLMWSPVGGIGKVGEGVTEKLDEQEKQKD